MPLNELFQKNSLNISSTPTFGQNLPTYAQNTNIGLTGLFQSPENNTTDTLDKVMKQSANMRTRIEAAGEGKRIESSPSFNITKLLEFITRPGYAANALIREFTDPMEGHTPGEFDPLKAFWRGLTGKEKPSGGDLVRDLGIENKFLSNSLGFVFDVFNPLDVLNWVTFGAGKAVTTTGLKGTKALTKAFGEEATGALTNILGEGIEKIGSKSVGGLSKEVMALAKNSGIQETENIAKIMIEGMTNTHNTLTTKIPYKEIKRLTVGFEAPGLSRLSIGKPVEIPGSEAITGPVGLASSTFMNTKVGDKLGKMFSTKYKPKEVPDTVILKNIQEKGVKLTESVIRHSEMGTVPEIIDNSMEIGKEVNKAVQSAVNFTEAEGSAVWKQWTEGINQIFQDSAKNEDAFRKQIETMFRGTTREERQLVLDAVLDTNKVLPEKLVPIRDGFMSWRESIIKDYNNMGIPVHELENYVPFIPLRALKESEKAGLQNILGTKEATSLNVEDDVLELIRRIDPYLNPRTTAAIDPREVNKLLDTPWLSEDPLHLMMVRGTRAIRAKEAFGFLDGFLDVYGLTKSDLAKLKTMPTGYSFYENVVDNTGARMLKQVTGLKGDAKNIVAIPEEFAKIFNDYMELFYNKDSSNAIIRLYDKASNVWKNWAYTYNPGHIPRDFRGNIQQGWLMGMRNPKYYKHAAETFKDTVPEMERALQSLNKGLMPDLKLDTVDNTLKSYKKAIKEGRIVPNIINLGNKEVDVYEAWLMAQKNGVLGNMVMLSETPRNLQKMIDAGHKERGMIRKLGQRYGDLMREWTESSNNWARFAGYLHQLNKGKGHIGAASQVKKFYFDYFDLTPFEKKVMKRLVPFYTWTRKNIPMEIEALLKRPKDFTQIQKGIDALGGENREEDLPNWAEATGLIKMGDSGKYINPNMPYQDLGRVPVNRQNIANLLASINPLIRGPIEMITNTQMYSGKPLERYKGEEQDLPIIGALMRLAGSEDIPQVDKRGLGYLVEQLPMLKNIDTVLNPENARQMARLGSMVGLPSYFEAEQLQRSKIYDENKKLNELIRLLKDRGIEIPDMKDINTNPREELLKKLGINIPKK